MYSIQLSRILHTSGKAFVQAGTRVIPLLYRFCTKYLLDLKTVGIHSFTTEATAILLKSPYIIVKCRLFHVRKCVHFGGA